ncbi:MAG: RDD family protein [Acidimicrobiales bacterium]
MSGDDRFHSGRRMSAAGPDPLPGEAAGSEPDPDRDRLATIGSRAAARLLDGLIVGLPLTVLVFVTSDVNTARNTVSTPAAVQVLAVVVAAVYEVMLIHTRGQTVGKRVMGIQVVRVNDGRFPDWTASVMRYLLPVLPAFLPIPGAFLLSLVIYLVAVPHPLRRGWHDRAAGTIVVKAGPPPDPDAADDPLA